MIKHDFHLHSYFSTDSEEKQENIIEEALERGFSGICFTDHMDFYFPLECSKKSGGDFNFDADEYYDCIMKFFLQLLFPLNSLKSCWTQN